MEEEKDIQKKAEARVRRLRNFYSNVTTFVFVNVLLLIINLIASPQNLWFYWVTLIWGIILLVQAFNIFTIRDKFLGDEWEKKKIKEIVKEHNSKKKKKD
ncbi:MAG: 2TM domain-containing protein [Chlamydiales bacterium]